MTRIFRLERSSRTALISFVAALAVRKIWFVKESDVNWSVRKPFAFGWLFTLLLWQPLSAQQLPQYSLYMLDPVQLNPAAAGLENTLVATGAYRAQWTGLPGNPVGQRISAHLPLNIINSGIGFAGEIDELGARRYSRFGVAYNYQLTRGKNKFSLGVNARMNQLRLFGDRLRTPDGTYDPPQNVLVHNDDLLPNGELTSSQFSLGAGLYYKGEQLEVGISALHLNAPVVELESLDWTLARQYNLFVRYTMDIFGSWQFIPSALVRNDGVQTQAELSAVFQRDENIFLGTSVRGYNESTLDAVVLLAGLKVSPKITLAYAYDLSLSGLRDVQSGTHEVVIGYRLGTPIGAGSPPPIIYNPRTKE
ncbi:hypothetical protein CEQ90_05245 [Lewinellaceae bacterium SD302]|nr:hypothetical protein CEQ90_05245 [Lewinellaceae bacterium SD302]